MAQRLGSAVDPTSSRLIAPRTLPRVAVPEIGVNLHALEEEVHLAALADVPVLVTADTLATAKRVACAILDQLPESRAVAFVSASDGAATQLAERLATHSGSILFEDVGALDDDAQAVLLAFLQNRSGSHANDIAHGRIIATGLSDLYSRVKTGTFRDRLFYHLNVIHIIVSLQMGAARS
jgi:transcriptional regulator of acetoin/glycerol metabolism